MLNINSFFNITFIYFLFLFQNLVVDLRINVLCDVATLHYFIQNFLTYIFQTYFLYVLYGTPDNGKVIYMMLLDTGFH